MMTTPDPSRTRALHRALLALLALWALTVIVAAQSGALALLYPPVIAAIVAVTILVPTAWYFASDRLRAYMDGVGHRRIILFHSWRIPAALLFFWYGFQGALPPLFWIFAGVGDLMAGSYALWLSSRPQSAAQIRSFHLFGFADFVVAVGTGLTYTLLLDPRMAPIATLPLALVPLFGVGISGATHLMAFDMLRRGTGLSAFGPPGGVSGAAAQGGR
jgi:hypothetical protein